MKKFGKIIDIDVYYSWRDNGVLTLQGLSGACMNYDKNMKQWKLDVAHSSVSETSKAAHASFTLGKQNWMIQGHGDFNDGKE